MKTKTKQMRQLATIIVLICINSSLFSNDTINYKNQIDFTFSNIKFAGNYFQLNNILILQFDYNRNINDVISMGGYCGAGMYDEWLVERGNYQVSYEFMKYRYSVHYGINTNFHIIPLIFKTIIPRFDLFISADFGFISMFTSPYDNIFPEKGHYFDYSFGGGGSIFLSKKLGLLIEAGYKEFKYHKGFFAKYGLTYRF